MHVATASLVFLGISAACVCSLQCTTWVWVLQCRHQAGARVSPTFVVRWLMAWCLCLFAVCSWWWFAKCSELLHEPEEMRFKGQFHGRHGGRRRTSDATMHFLQGKRSVSGLKRGRPAKGRHKLLRYPTALLGLLNMCRSCIVSVRSGFVFRVLCASWQETRMFR